MKDLNEYETMFMIFASSLAQFGSDIEEANFSGEVGFISSKTAGKLQKLYLDVIKDIEEVREYKTNKNK
jgi:hypothetical protein